MTLKKEYIYFWLSALIIFILGLFTFSDKNAVIDINIHDTYYIIHIFHLITLISLLYFILGSIYWMFKKLKIPLIKNLSLIHLFITIGGLLIYFLLMTLFKDDTEIEPGIYNESSTLGTLLIILFFLIVFAQLLFLLNIIIGFIKILIKN